MDYSEYASELELLLKQRDATKWQLGDLFLVGDGLGFEASQALPASESVVHMLRIYAECSSLWGLEERNYDVGWDMHYCLRTHPERADWLLFCAEKGLQCNRVLKDLLTT